ncbi:MAG: FAD-dependent oxidoreductase [Patescibacteria group bacterium]|nr:FAD-dependent oxidoreductase [Patescibacteria group bacterium]
MYDLIIIGGGPAGVTAGIYGVRKGLKTLVITKDFIGQAGTATIIENWPGEKNILGIELMQKFQDHLRHINPETIEGDVVKKITKEEDGSFLINTVQEKEVKGKTVIITSGRNPRPLKVLGEEKFVGKGVSYCTTCDGPLFREKKVVVVGGGNSAFENAIELGNYCEKVYLLSLKNIADQVLQNEAKTKDNIEIVEGAVMKEVKGEEMMEAVIYQSQGKEHIVEVSGMFVSIGSVPVTEFVGDLVEFTERGEIKVDHFTGETKTHGIFSAGDVTNVRDKQIIIASAEGAKAAISAYKYINNI